MGQPHRVRSGIAPLGANAARRLEFILGMLTGQQIIELGTRGFRTEMAEVVSAGLHLRGATGAILVGGGGVATWSCVSCLWGIGAFDGPPVRIGQVYVSGTVRSNPIELEPEQISLD